MLSIEWGFPANLTAGELIDHYPSEIVQDLLAWDREVRGL